MPTYLEIEVSLVYAEPKMWRKFLIRNTASFDKLHAAIQIACGWENCHLYGFYGHRPSGADFQNEIAAPAMDDMFGFGEESQAADASKLKLNKILAKKGDKCNYVYDMGDNWDHVIKVVKVEELDEKFGRKLLAGKRAFPFEDCGGIPGYEELVALNQKPEDELDMEDAEQLDYYLGDQEWDPEHFDLKSTKKKFDRKT